MFEAKMPQGALMKKLLDALKDLVKEANWELSSAGMSLQAMDTSHVSLVSVLLKSSGFEDYRCDNNCVMGISLQAMTKVMRCCNNDDSLSIEYNDSEVDKQDKVKFEFVSGSGDRTSEFKVNLMHIDAEHLALNDEEWHAEIKMPSNEFQRICRDLSAFGDAVQITVVKNSIKFKVVGGEDGEASMTILEKENDDIKEEDRITISVNDPVSLTFSFKYLHYFCRGAPLSPQVVLTLTKEKPLIVKYDIENIGDIKYYLAPKVDDEEGADDDDHAGHVDAGMHDDD